MRCIGWVKPYDLHETESKEELPFDAQGFGPAKKALRDLGEKP